MTDPPPHRIVTERLVLRSWQPEDAPLAKDAVDSSLDHLRPWMPWAHEHPMPLAGHAATLRAFRGNFDLGHDFIYGVFSADESEVLGGTGLHPRVGDAAFEIGYWIRADRAGEGLGTEAAAALTRVAFEVCGVERLEVRIDPANEASRAIPRRLGYAEEATLRRRLHGPTGKPRERDAVVYTLFREDFPGTPSASAPVEAFDALGKRVH